MPPLPKTAATRRRTNHQAGASVLAASSPRWTKDRIDGVVPELTPWPGARRWRPETLEWWTALWKSPMRTEYAEVDFFELVELAKAKDDLAKVRDPLKRPKLLAEIRMQEQRFGLDPVARRRLQWEIDKGDEATERTQQRQQRRTATRVREQAADPREMFKAVS